MTTETSYDVNSAVAHVRHVIQEHAPSDFELGGSACLGDIRWMAGLLGWEFPEAYLRTIQVHDGVFAGGDRILASDCAFETLKLFRDHWHRADGYWPVGADGCGNYWTMNIQQQGDFPPGTVFFYDHERDMGPSILSDVFERNYPVFVSAIMQRSCDAVDCRWNPQDFFKLESHS